MEFSNIKNMVGVQMLNLIETVPEGYSQEFYPEILRIIIELKSTKDKLYLLFETGSSYIRMKSEIYSKENL